MATQSILSEEMKALSNQVATLVELMKPRTEEEYLIDSAKSWLNDGCWTKRGKRAYTHSVATSLLSIAMSLEKLTNKEEQNEPHNNN